VKSSPLRELLTYEFDQLLILFRRYDLLERQRSKNMTLEPIGPGQIIDLTKMAVERGGLDGVDVALIVVSGGVGYLAKKAIQYFFPGTPSLSEQIDNMVKLMEAGSKAGAKKMVFRMTNSANIFPALGNNRFSIQSQNASTIEFEVEFS
jgi:hypothetical protein